MRPPKSWACVAYPNFRIQNNHTIVKLNRQRLTELICVECARASVAQWIERPPLRGREESISLGAPREQAAAITF